MSLSQTKNPQQPGNSQNVLSPEEMDKWFSSFVEGLQVDHMMLEADVAPKEIKDLYTGLIKMILRKFL